MKRNLAALSCHIRHLVLHFNSLWNSTLGNIKETDEGHVNPQKTSSLTHLLLIFNIPSSWHCNSSVRMPAGPCKIQHLYWIPAIIQQDHLGHLIYIGKSKKTKNKKDTYMHCRKQFFILHLEHLETNVKLYTSTSFLCESLNQENHYHFPESDQNQGIATQDG